MNSEFTKLASTRLSSARLTYNRLASKRLASKRFTSTFHKVAITAMLVSTKACTVATIKLVSTMLALIS